MNRFIFFAQLFWKVTTFCFKLVLKSVFLLLLFPIKLVLHSVKSGVDYIFKDTKLNSKQLETIEKIFEYIAYYAWGQNLLPDSIFKTWYTQLTAGIPILFPYMDIVTVVSGIISWLIAFNLRGRKVD